MEMKSLGNIDMLTLLKPATPAPVEDQENSAAENMLFVETANLK